MAGEIAPHSEDPAMNKKYRVTLTDEEREDLEQMLRKGKAAARKLSRARILLKVDAAPGGPAWTDEQVCRAIDISPVTVYRVRQDFVEHGLQAVFTPRPRGHRHRKLDGDQEAHLIALACSTPPPGRRRWTLRLLTERFVELEKLEGLSHETVRQTLKKTS
jgi:transposase